MTDSWTWEWRLKAPGGFRIVTAVFIAVSLYFASAPISSRFGNLAGYAYWIIGIVLILALLGSISISMLRNKAADIRTKAAERSPPL